MDKLQQVYNVFSEDPLRADQDAMYVDLSEVRGESEGLLSLAQNIRLSKKPISQVLAGHKGSGKSTELLRLQKKLQSEAGGKYFVVYWEADKDIDRNDVDFPDVLIGIIRQLATDIRERLGITLKPSYFKDRWERVKKLALSEVSFDGLSLEAGMLTLSSTIKNSPDARLDVRKLLDPDTTNWLYAANDVIGNATVDLLKLGYRGLVILVDDLDKMQVRHLEHAGCSSTENLFVHRAAQLTGFACHTVYALPLSLAYSHQELAIKANFGGDEVPVVPMVKIATPPPDGKGYLAGIKRMQEIIRVRCESAGITTKDLFKTAAAEKELIRISGGQPSVLMALVRSAIATRGLPIDGAMVDKLCRKGEREYARMLLREHWPIIEEVRSSGQYARSAETDEQFRQLIDSRAILQYANGREWYALNPMIERLSPPAPRVETAF